MTIRQRMLLLYWRERRTPPSLADALHATGADCPCAIRRDLDALVIAGHLRRTGLRTAPYRLTTKEQN